MTLTQVYLHLTQTITPVLDFGAKRYDSDKRIERISRIGANGTTQSRMKLGLKHGKIHGN